MKVVCSICFIESWPSFWQATLRKIHRFATFYVEYKTYLICDKIEVTKDSIKLFSSRPTTITKVIMLTTLLS